MKSLLLSASLATAALATSLTGALAEPVYMMAQITIEDHQRYFDEYGAAVAPIALGAGAKVLVATPTVQNLEGKWDGNWTVVIEFPSEDAAMNGWYNSDAYADVRKLRLETTSLNNLIIAPAFVPPSQ